MKKLQTLPTKPGIYKFLDGQEKLLYVGKAKNLKNRVKSYFSKSSDLSPAKQQMVEKIKKIEYIVVANETEALLLEANLIKKYRPPYNIDLKNGKSWVYVKITDNEFPQVIIIRKKEEVLNLNLPTYFGPYTSALAIRQTLRMLKKIFPYYTESGPMINLSKNVRSRLHLGRYLNEPHIDKAEWLKNIRLIKKFLNGKNEEFKAGLEKAMKQEAQRKNFERAARIRDQLKYLGIISQKQQVIKNNKVDENYLLKVRKNFQTLKGLQKILKLKKLPAKIEAYDISNIQGQMAVGSMVVMIDGKINKNEYRRFKIKTVKGANDPAMIAEVIKRRFKHTDWPTPDLILIDGGLTQLNAALKSSTKIKNRPTIISLAKKNEEIYFPNQAIPLRLPKFSPALQLLQQIRDEAHRFATAYYRKLHLAQFDNLPNICYPIK